MPKKTEIILREGKTIVRDTVVTETIVGETEELISKYVAIPSIAVPYIGTVKYGLTRAEAVELPVGLITLSRPTTYDLGQILLYCVLPKIYMRTVFDEFNKALFESNSFNKSEVLTVDLEKRVSVFCISLAQGVSGSRFLAAYHIVLRDGQAYRFLAPNHYRDGRCCLGSFDAPGSRRTALEVLQSCLESYVLNKYNRDLLETRHLSIWTRGSDLKWNGQKHYEEADSDIVSTTWLKDLANAPEVRAAVTHKNSL